MLRVKSTESSNKTNWSIFWMWLKWDQPFWFDLVPLWHEKMLRNEYTLFSSSVAEACYTTEISPWKHVPLPHAWVMFLLVTERRSRLLTTGCKCSSSLALCTVLRTCCSSRLPWPQVGQQGCSWSCRSNLSPDKVDICGCRQYAWC